MFKSTSQLIRSNEGIWPENTASQSPSTMAKPHDATYPCNKTNLRNYSLATCAYCLRIGLLESSVLLLTFCDGFVNYAFAANEQLNLGIYC